jgi:hypothetical protein
MPRRHEGRKFRNLLLKRGFQLKYTGMVLGLSIVLSIALGSFLLLQVRENSRMLRLEAEFDPVFAEQIARSDATLTLTLVGALLLFNVVLAVVSVAVTHRMAGPIYVVERYLDALADGRLPQMRHLRRGDEFVDLWMALRRLVDAEERAAQRDVEILRSVIDVLDRDTRGQSSAHALRELLERRERMLSSPEGATDPRPSLDDGGSKA